MNSNLVEIRPQQYKDPRPREYFDKFYRRAMEKDPKLVYELARRILVPYCKLLYRPEGRGVYNVPQAGGVILAPNHFSNLDHFFVGMFLKKHRIRYIAKSQLFTKKFGLEWILSYGGAIPVRRGHDDDRWFEAAKKVIEKGGVVLMYPEGGRSRSGKISEKARPGIGRLALETGAPVVPVAIHGSQRARNWKKLQFPKVTVQFGRPEIAGLVPAPSRSHQLKAAEGIFRRVRRLYEQLEASVEISKARA